MLEKELCKSKGKINEIDSKGRTSMDLAALTGQIDLMELIESNEGEFAFRNGARMRAIAKNRAPHMGKYLAEVCAHVGL
jgi:ankyrin repeat protein